MDHKKSIRTVDAVEWIISNYENIRETQRKFTLYIWTGTCDLTPKNKHKKIQTPDQDIGSHYIVTVNLEPIIQ